VEVLILDEADRMLDMGFIHDIRKILAMLPNKEQRQNLLFSATFSNEIKQLSHQFLNQPELVEVARRNTPIELIAQLVHPVDQGRKREMLSHMIGAGNWRQVLVFTRTKHGANRLAKQLVMDGLSATAIHGNKSQGARTRALADFKQGSVRILVATDIAARGLDIDQLPHVVNYELPNVPEDYVHRIGRTGRAGNEGTAISLVSGEENRMLRDIERLINREIPKQVLPGYEPTGRTQASSDDRAGSARPGQRRSKPAPQAGRSAGANGRSNGRGNGQSNSRSNGQSNSRSNGQSNSRSNGQSNSRSNGQSNSRSDGQSNSRGNGKTNGRSNVQAIDSNRLRNEATRSANGERAARQGNPNRSPAGNRPAKPGYSTLADRMFSKTDSN
jgi:ATP-dependent RNA helicase RhlE